MYVWKFNEYIHYSSLYLVEEKTNLLSTCKIKKNSTKYLG